MEAKDTVMSNEVIREAIALGENVDAYCGAITGGDKGIAEAQAEISFKAGIKKVVEWVKANANLERGDRDVGLCFEDYLHFDYKAWQSQLKEWGIDKS